MTENEEFVVQHEKKKKRRRKKKRIERFQDHLQRRIERIEPTRLDGLRPEDCQQIGIDIVEMLEFERPRLWVRRLEYPEYVIPSEPELNVVQGEREPV